MMVEKLVQRPRHVEVQVLADHHGIAAALFERECSIQRRHQKLIEESPSPLFLEERPERQSLWAAMRDAAIALVGASGYQNAGTVEFLFDAASGEFYFMEVNARLQVEHPVTEAVTGLDLVKWQLRIAGGESLALPQDILLGDRAALRGHAIEARIVAEDPGQGFMPSSGEILGWAEPRIPGVRVDTGFGPGAEVSRHYDSLLAKVIAHAETRTEAIERLRAALEDFHILGVKTNVAFMLEVLAHPRMVKGDLSTGFLEAEFADWRSPQDVPSEIALLARPAGTESPQVRRHADGPLQIAGAWSQGDGFRLARG
jgi:acetyl/propionyl-CoA carboxylase alpha subunit